MNHSKKKFIYFICLLFLIKVECFSQKHPSVHYSIDDGLPNSLIFQMVCDKKGYMWFATDNGLSKFDGKKFTNYFSELKKPDYITAIVEDKNERIIAGAYGNGLYLAENGTFKSLVIAGLPSKLYATRLLYDDSNNLWLYDNHTGLIYYVTPNNKVTTITLSQFSNQTTKVNSFCVFNSNSVLVGTNNGAYVYSVKTKSSKKIEGIDTEVHDIVGSNSEFVFTSTGCVYSFKHNTTSQIKIPGAEKELIVKVLANKDGGFFLAGYAGKCFKLSKTYALEDVSNKFLLQNSTITNATHDQEGNVWISTYGSGVYCYFNFDIINYSLKDGLSGNYITGLAELNSTVYASAINSKGKLNFFNGDTVGSFKINESGEDIVYIGNLSAEELEICPGTNFNNYILSQKRGKLSVRKMANTMVVKCALYKHGKTFMGTYKCGVLNYKQGDIAFGENTVEKLATKTVNDVLEQNNRFYFGTDSGVFVFNKDFSFVNSFHEREGLLSKKVNAILSVRDSIWILTEMGINILYQNKLVQMFVFQQLNQKTVFNQIVYDKKNRVWIGTTNGLFYYDLNKKEFVSFSVGLASKEVKKLFIDSKNFLWVGTSNGISRIDLERIQATKEEIPFYVNSITIDSNIVNSNKFEIYLPYNHKKLNLNVSSPVFRDVAALRYLYAFNSDKQNQIKWEESKDGNVDLFNLKSGEYELLIKAEQLSSQHQSKIITYKIHVSYPFWQTWWFYCLLLISLLLIFYKIAMYRIKSIRNQEKAKAELQIQFLELEQKALSALIHPHFIFNALNSIQIYISKNQKELAHNFLSKFARLIRLTLESVYQKEIILDEEVQRLSLYMDLEILRLNDQFTYSFVIDESLEQDNQKLPTMLIQPFIENAIWHGIKPVKDLKGEIAIELKKVNEQQLKITVSDNGIGINAAKRNKQEDSTKSSLGLKITMERLDLLSKMKNQPFGVEITDLSESDPSKTGTKVTILVPLS